MVPLYTAYLTPTDYGVLALLLLFSTVAKILFRLGLDGAFFRVHYDLHTDQERRTLAGTVALFAGLAGTVLFVAVAIWARPLTRLLFGADAPAANFLVLVALDIYLGTFAFVPLNLLRIQDRPGLFSTFSIARHAVNTILKVILVARGLGVLGVLLADATATGFFSLVLAPILARNASFSPSFALLREVLRFGLPKVPHGLMIQAQNLADRKILDLFVSRADLGLYQMGYTFGLGVKFALSAFEPAWQPFVYSRIRTPDAPRTLARIATYVWAVFVACALPLAIFSQDLLRLMTFKNPTFWAAAPIIPPIVLAYLLHGGFLLTSIGIAIQKRATFYPLITAVAAGTNIVGNFLLVPRFGTLGAAWATVLCYAVMLVLGLLISQRLYPIPLEWRRLLGLAAAALSCFGISLIAPQPLVLTLSVKLAALLVFPILVVAFILRDDERLWLRAKLRLG